LQGLLVIFLLEVCHCNLYKIMYRPWILNH
jgi:hypothetical protein